MNINRGKIPKHKTKAEVAADETYAEFNGRQKEFEYEEAQCANNFPGRNENFLDFNTDNIIRGIVLSEILSKPKSLRRGR